MKLTRRIITLVLAAIMIFGAATTFASCNRNKTVDGYTLKSYSTALGNNWNDHTWETNADDTIMSYISSPFCTMSILDSVNGVYQWVYEMATSIKDVTKDHQDDLTKYKVDLAEGKTAADMKDGYVFEIALNPNAKWENGTVINADSYIYSMQQLLNSKMRNYRANLYYAGESAVAGGAAYYNSESPVYTAMVPAYGDGEEGDYSYDLEAGITKGEVYINLSSTEMTLYSQSLNDLHTSYGVGDDADYVAVADAANPYGYTKLTAENKETALKLVGDLLSGLFSITDPAEIAKYTKEALFVNNGQVGEKVEYDAVGCYKVDDYTIRYVTQYHIDINYFLTSCTSTWLVYEELYEAGKDTTGELVTTNYCTSKETTMSYGPYKIESFQDGKQIVFVQNENWYGYEKQKDGSLISYTNFLVDGEKRQQYMTTKVIVDVMDDSAAKQAFLKGDLAEWTPTADDLVVYSTSEQLYKIDETYTQSFFFDTNLTDLQEMDKSKGNTNSVVMSNANFRRGFSLGIDRAEWVTATEGFKPAYAIMNNLYFYDVYNDPTSSYRNSDEAMQAVCNLYDVKYGAGTPYATLKDAYQSINGYNLTEAKAAMKKACEELVADGLYTAGAPIHIRIGWMKGALDSPANKQCELIEKYLNAAIEGSGFGAITLEPIGNLTDRYGDVGTRGEFAIGFGAWGGAAFYPFRNFQVYCDNEQYSLHEGRCWDPASENLTLKVDGADVTKTWKEWSGALIGNGDYASASFAVKLSITAQMEEAYLKKYYRIPLAGTTQCFMVSYQISYYTQVYNIMYDFGGFRLMKYNYTDAQWTEFVASQNGALKYE